MGRAQAALASGDHLGHEPDSGVYVPECGLSLGVQLSRGENSRVARSEDAPVVLDDLSDLVIGSPVAAKHELGAGVIVPGAQRDRVISAQVQGARLRYGHQRVVALLIGLGCDFGCSEYRQQAGP
ncbi:hypothetical protein OG795_18575 [[Kitasatospora] papulosa]|uniref:hypothetical protein n=1 Tax=[Kitasatospora] papulosa TaxID=1464011 RepID=UPI00324D6C75